MKKNLLAVSLCAALTSGAYASKIENLSLDVGVGSINYETTYDLGIISVTSDEKSESGLNINLEVAFTKRSELNKHVVYTLFGYGSYGDISTGDVGLGYRYYILDSLALGIHATAGYVDTEFDSYIGFPVGADIIYAIDKDRHHSLKLDYSTGTFSEESAVVDIDLSKVSFGYKYSF